ncbi:hypothetical protein, partial [Colwellia psychrerythraea]
SVKHLQIQKTTVLVKFNSLEGAETGWKLVGYHAHEGTKEMYSALLSSQMSSKSITFRVSASDSSCTVQNISSSLEMVKTI